MAQMTRDEYMALGGRTEADWNYYSVEAPKALQDSRSGKLQVEALNERLGLGETGALARVGNTFFDPRRGVNVGSQEGQYFEELEGGGIRIKTGALPTGVAVSNKPVGASSPEDKATGVESIAIKGAEGKTVQRTGTTLKNPQTGVDVNAQEGNIVVEYTDGTYEERPAGQVQTPTESKKVGESGKSAEELGITRKTEIKGGAGGEVTRAPMSAAEALAAAKTPEEKDAVIQAEGLASTANLEFIGAEYTDQKSGERRVAKEGYAFYQDPKSDKILERPVALQTLAKQSTSPSVLAEREAAKVNGPSFSNDVKSAFSNAGLQLDDQKAIQALRDEVRSIPNAMQLYNQMLASPQNAELMKEVADKRATLADLSRKFEEDVASVTQNPYLSEALRSKKIQGLQDKYEMRKANMTNELNIARSFLQDNKQEAQWLVGQTMQQANADRTFDTQLLQMSYERADQRFNEQMQLANYDLNNQQFENQKAQFQQTFGQGQLEFKANFGMKQKEFEENVRQFGVSKSLELMKMNEPKDLSEFEQLLATLPPELKEKAINEKLGITDLIGGEDNGLAQDSLLALQALSKNPGLNSAVGLKGLSSLFGKLEKPIPGTPAANFLAELERVKSLVTLPNLAYLKGKGAMSDKDLALIQSAASSLSPNMSNKAFRAELDRIIPVMQKAVEKLNNIPQPQQQFMGGEIESVTPTGNQSSTGTKNILSSLGAITGLNGSSAWKWGLDIDLKKGQPVPSATNGKVIASAFNGGFGNQVKILGDDGREYWYSHLDKRIATGQRVTAGQTIGLGGNTGKTIPGRGGDGSHLDLTVLQNGKYLPAKSVAQLLKSYA